MSTELFSIRAAVTEAEQRAGRRQTRLLIIALLALSVIAAAAVAGFFLAYSQARKNAGLTKRVISIQQRFEESAVTGRATLSQVAALALQIADFTDPKSPIQQQQQARVAGYLQSLITAQQTLNADQLRKLGEMAIALGAPKALVNRILNEPVPVITFGAPARPQSSGSSGTPATAPSPPGTQMQSLPTCPDAILQVAPAGLVGICVTLHPR